MQLNAPPKAGSKSTELVGRPLVITGIKGWQHLDATALGKPADAVVIDVLVLDTGTPNGFEGDDDYSPGEPELKHVPDVLIFWGVVQRQLTSDDFTPPVAGKFEQKGKAYTLEPLTEEELAVVQGLM